MSPGSKLVETTIDPTQAWKNTNIIDRSDRINNLELNGLILIDDIKIKLTAMKVKSMEIEKAIAEKRPEEEIKFLTDELKQMAMEIAKG